MLSVFHTAERHPTALSLVTEREALTFAELAMRVEATARSLNALGLLASSGSAVALVARPTLRSLEVLHALISYGVPILLIHPRLPHAERKRLVECVAARALVIPDEQPLPATRQAAGAPPTELDATAPLAIVPTSGTTGTPRLALLSRRACLASAQASVENLALSEADRWLLCLPLSHVGGLSIVTRSLLAGSAAVPFDSQGEGLAARLPELAQCLTRARVSVASFVPTILDGLLRLEPEWQPEPGLRAVLIGGAPVSSALFDRAVARRVPIRTTYGLTEACSQVTASSAANPPRIEAGRVSSGRALLGNELAIGADARIRIRGPNLFSGYIGDEQPLPATRWFVTDDLGRLAPDGELFVLGRASELIITGGENVDPRRVEAALERDPRVRAAVVFGVPDDRFGEIVACVLVGAPDLDLAALGRQLSNDLARHELPRRVARAANLSILPTGKIDRKGMRAAALAELEPWKI